MDNPTLDTKPIELTTPKGNHKVIIKPYATGRDRMEIRGALLQQMKISQTSGKDDNIEFNAAAMQEASKKALERLVISVDGQPDNILDRVLDMHEDDTQAVVDKIDQISKLSSLDDNQKKS